MLRRVALIGLLLLMSGVAAIFAADHFGIRLPWETSVATTPQATKSEKPAAAEGTPGRSETARDATDRARDVIEDATAALTPPPSAQTPKQDGVEIDISRISPEGTSVFAGRAEPDTYVTVYENGKVAGSVKADANGEWSLATEHKFASADPKLNFETSKTAPPEPEPAKPAEKVAAATPPPPSEQKASANAAAGEVMRKFEKLVEDAREEAKKHREAAAPPQAEAPLAVTPDKPAEPQETPTVTVEAPNPGASSLAASGTSTPTPPSSTERAAAPEQSAATQTVIPVPIMFVYNEATLTSEGKRAADLLLEYLTLKELKVIELTGHADERGTPEYNMDLSRDRLETVSALLRQGGYEGELKLTPKGKSEPYLGVDRSLYKGEALFQLDRRVELRVH